MANNNETTTKFKVDISELKSAMQEAKRQIQVTNSEFKAISSSMEDWGNSSDGLKAKLTQLNSNLNSQKTVLSSLEKQYELTVQEMGEGSAEADRLKIAINNQKAVVNGTQKEINKYEGALDDLENAEADAGDEAEELGKDVEKAGENAKGAGDGFTVFKGVLANLVTQGINLALDGIKSLGSAMVDMVKESVSAYADYEQLVGGVETLFKDSADIVMEYANNAYKTAGLSANEYMETVTSFSASLLSALGGDTEASAKVADMAITDMSDNANKMGTDIEMIQNAYNGFAKQNYTMLDNLKLGYGGTKEEMQRLLEDAEKLSGQKYDISNLNDVFNAIHVIQTELDITGTTAKEASTTISGSIASMGSAWQNLLAGMADKNANMEQLIGNLVESVTIMLSNVLPVVTQAISGLGQLISGLAPIIAEELPNIISEVLPTLLSALSTLLESVLSAIVEALPQITEAVMDVLLQLVTTLIGMLPEIVTTVLEMITTIMGAIGKALPQIIDAIVEVIPQIIDALVTEIPKLIETIIGAIPQILSAIVNAIPTIINGILTIIPVLIDSIMTQLPVFINACVQFLMGIVQAIPTVIEAIVEALPQIITSIINGLTSGVTALINGAITLLMAIVDAFPVIIEAIVNALPDILDAIISGLLNAMPQLLDACITLLMAIVEAIPTIIVALVDALPDIIQAIMDAFLNNIPLMIETTIKLFTAIITAIPTIIVALTKALPQIIKAIMKVMVTLIPQLAKFVVEIINKIAEWGKSIGLKGAETAYNFTLKVIDKIKQLPDKIWTWLVKVVTKVVEWGVNLAKKGKEGAVNLFNAVVNNIKGLPDKIKTIGSDLVKGLWNGINDMTEWVIGKIKGFGESVLGGIKDFFGIHSPSRVMRDEVGKYLAMGIAEGITENADYVEKSVEEIGEAILKSAKNTLDKYKVYKNMSLAEEVAYWNSIRKTIKKGTDARVDADKEYLTKKAELNEKLEKLETEYAEDVQEVYDDLAENIKKAMDKYDEAVEKRASSIVSSLALLKGFEADEAVGKKELTDNLKSQVDALTEWDNALTQLASRNGVTKSFMNTIEGLGVTSLDTIKEIVSMTDEELATYLDLYAQKDDIARQRAEKENEDLKASTDADIAILKENASTKIQELTTTYSDKLSELGVTLKTKSKNIGENSVSAIIKGLKSKSKELYSYVKEIMSTMVEEANTQLANLIPEDLTKSISTSTKSALTEVKKATSNAVSSAKSGLNNTSATASSKASTGNTVINNFNQTNNSPKALNRLDIYRQSKNLLGYAGGGA